MGMIEPKFCFKMKTPCKGVDQIYKYVRCSFAFRDFLRLGAPLSCAAEDDDFYDGQYLDDQDLDCSNSSFSSVLNKPDTKPTDSRGLCTDGGLATKARPNGGPVPLTRVKCLVSMTTLRDIRLHGAAITPSFVEFDMSSEGFGCLYLPSIAPQSPTAPSVVTSGIIGGTDAGVISGMGSGNSLVSLICIKSLDHFSIIYILSFILYYFRVRNSNI